jgi:hypothetical protein
MKPDSFLVTLMTFFLGLAGIVLFAGCELDAYVGEEVDNYVENDEVDTYVAPTTATIRGKVVSFDGGNTVLARRPTEDEGEEGRRANIVVTLEGPVSLVAETDGDGEFVFAEIAAGTYEVTFECDGVEVRYRGRSGQTATLTVGADEILELTEIRIAGGKVNIGNIRVFHRGDPHAVDDDDEVEVPEEPEPVDDDDVGDGDCDDDEEPVEPEEPEPPIDLTGKWLLTTASDAGNTHQRHLLLTHAEYQLTGEIVGSEAVVGGETDGETIWMRVELIGEEIVATYYTGVVECRMSLRGTWVRSDGVEGVWEADKILD